MVVVIASILVLVIFVLFSYFGKPQSLTKNQLIAHEYFHNDNIQSQVPSRLPRLPRPSRYPKQLTPTLAGSLEHERLNHITNEFVQTNNWSLLLLAGDIYARGSYPRYQPNELLAIKIFKQASMCPDGHVAGLAQVRIIETRDYPLHEADRHGDMLDTSFGERLCHLAHERILREPRSNFQKPSAPIKYTSDTPQTRRATTEHNNIPKQHQTQRNFGGAQNVHDHAVINIMKNNLIKFDTPGENEGLDESLAEVTDCILRDRELSDVEKTHAMAVLERISEHRSTDHSIFGKSELQILDAVWRVLKTSIMPKNKSLYMNLVTTLGKQLASGVEQGSVVCSTGRVTRILATFDGTDLSNYIGSTIETVRPIGVVREELFTLAAKVREDELKVASPDLRAAYINDDPLLRHKSDIMKEIITKAFRDKARDVYVSELGMSPNIIRPLVDACVEAF